MTWTFEVLGPLRGYSVRAGMYHDPKWAAFKRQVRLIANLAGVPFEPTETTSIHVEIHWRLKARIDGSNIFKGLEDAIFPKDRLLCAGSWVRHLDSGPERVIVTVES